MDGDEYMLRCMRYIDLNMVRAGVVKHPSQWPWCGYDELAGLRNRYRLINRGSVLESFWRPMTFESFSQGYIRGIDEAIHQDKVKHEPAWTQSLAVGRPSFLSKIETSIKTKLRCTQEKIGNDGLWVLREAGLTAYGS